VTAQWRGGLRAGVAVGLLAPVLALAAPAHAASSVSATPASVTQHGQVTLNGTLEWDGPSAGRAQLRLAAPGGPASPVATADSGQDPRVVAFTIGTAPCAPEGSALCERGNVVPNGRWAVELWEVQRSLDGVDRQVANASLFIDIPAGTPQEVTAVLDDRTVTVTWARGVGPEQKLVEPDVVWRVDDGDGRSVLARPSDCDGATCRAVFAYGDDESGPRSFTVSASRPCDGCRAAPATSAATDEVVIPVAAPTTSPTAPGAAPGGGSGPSAAPSTGAGTADATTPAPDGATGAAPGAGATAQGGTGRSQALSFAQGFSDFAPKLGLPKLPPLPDTAVAAPQIADGTYEESLGYQDQIVREPVVDEPVVDEPVAQGGRPGVLTSSDGPLGDEQVARSLAVALVLMLSGAHLRTWLARARADDGSL
jgi:hypothetical protein